MKIFGIISSNGDGSNSINWFKNPELAEHLLSSDEHYETFGCNEGSFAETINFPDGVKPEDCGISFSDNEYDDNFNAK
jgi:hypothetical protein